LRQSNSYSLEDALRVCEQHKLYREMAFVLQRMGSTHEALQLIVHRINDMKMALEFVQTQNDPDLMEELITEALANPEHVSTLLENIGSSIDPIRLIQRIPNGMEIPNLSDRLVTMMSDHNLQMSLQEGCNTILMSDCVELFNTLYAKKCRATRIDEEMRCATCQGIITKARAEDIVTFGCSHVYHLKCLVTASSTSNSAVPMGEDQKQQTASSMSQSAQPEQQGNQPAQIDKLWCVICKSAQTKRVLARKQQLAAQQQQMQRAAMARRAAAMPKIQPATAAVAAAAAQSAMSKKPSTNPFL